MKLSIKRILTKGLESVIVGALTGGVVYILTKDKKSSIGVAVTFATVTTATSIASAVSETILGDTKE